MDEINEVIASTPQIRGKNAEEIAAQKLRSLRYPVRMMPCHSPFDLLVNDKRVEVKTSSFSLGKWTVNLHRHGVLNESMIDAYLIILTEVPGGAKMPIYLIMPAPIGSTTLAISITSLIREYSKYVDNWQVLGLPNR